MSLAVLDHHLGYLMELFAGNAVTMIVSLFGARLRMAPIGMMSFGGGASMRRSINEETNQIFDEGSVLGSDFNIHGHFDPMVRKMVTELWHVPLAETQGVVRADRSDRPSKRQVEEHELENHAVYRNWCPVCVEARAAGSRHRPRTQQEKDERGPTIHADFFYMSTEEDSVPFLALKSGVSGRLHAVALQSKSPDDYVLKAFARFVEETGHKRVVFMSDNEPALVKLKTMVDEHLKNVEVVHKTCPVGDHAANGSIEVAVREIKRQMRSLRLSLERKWAASSTMTMCFCLGWPLLRLR